MSYNQITPEYYRMFQPDSAWHAGGEGWTQAPFPGWGANPNRVGPPRLAVNGLGCGCGGGKAMGAVTNLDIAKQGVPLEQYVSCPSGSEPFALLGGDMKMYVLCQPKDSNEQPQKPSAPLNFVQIAIAAAVGATVAYVACKRRVL